MIDREKVIKGLECCMSDSSECYEPSNGKCPYYKDDVSASACTDDLFYDIYALLKAQEPIKPIFDYDGNDVWRCGNCHCNIFHPSRTDADENEKNYRRFCFHCGQAVKWE